MAPAVLRHRLILNFEGQAEGVATDTVIEDILKTVDEPAAGSLNVSSSLSLVIGDSIGNSTP